MDFSQKVTFLVFFGRKFCVLEEFFGVFCKISFFYFCRNLAFWILALWYLDVVFELASNFEFECLRQNLNRF